MAVVTLRPNDVGDASQLIPVGDTPEWKCVDEVSTDEDTTYVYQPDVNDNWDLYNLGNLPGGITAISQVKVWVRVRKIVETLSASMRVYIKTGGTIYAGGIQAVTTSYADYSNTWATNPGTGVAWTVANINVLQAGVRLNTGIGSGQEARCTQVYVEVTYTVGVVTFIPKVFIM